MINIEPYIEWQAQKPFKRTVSVEIRDNGKVRIWVYDVDDGGAFLEPGDMPNLEWVRERRERAELERLAMKYGGRTDEQRGVA